MRAEEWLRLEEVVVAALEVEPARRGAWLDRACEGDPRLRAHAERLLDAHPRAEGFLERPPFELLEAALAHAGPALDLDPGAPRVEPGERIGRYVVVRAIGAGGMGEVYAARDPELDREVAIKRIPRRGGSPERLLREARTLARFSHPHVVTVHDAGRHGDGVFLAMELLPGGTLEEWLEAAPRDRSEVLDAFLEAARGLAAAHQAGVVHRDFKPANVLRDAAGTLQVADFGLARSAPGPALEETPGGADAAGAEASRPAAPVAAAGKRSTAAAMGTPSYMAPEQLLGRPAGPASDQFAFSVALWEALYGEHPFEGPEPDQDRDPRDGTARTLAGEPRRPPPGVRLPGRLRAALARGLARDPDRRWPSMAELIAELERVRGAGRRRAAVAAALGALAIAAGALWLGQSVAPPSGDAGTARSSLAVLPFAHPPVDPAEGADSDAAALGEGLTDELTAALARVEGLRVPARTSVFSLHERGADAAEIGRRLGVGHLLGGSVRRDGDRLHVSVELTEAAGGRPLWTESFDRPVDELFGVQEEIAREVVGRLGAPVAAGRPLVARPTASVEAYGFYLKGREQWNRRTEAGLRQAVELFERSVEEDPGFALAYAGLSDAWALLATYAPEVEPDALVHARAAAEHALELDPELAAAHASLGSVLVQSGEVAAAEAALRRAAALDPHYATARHWLGHLLVRRLGRLRAGIAELEAARRLDPASSAILATLAGGYYRAGRHREALEVELALRDLDPEWDGGGECITRNYIALGRPAEAVAAVEAVAPADRVPACWRGLADAHHLRGDFEAELAAARAGRELAPAGTHGLLVAEAGALAALDRPREVRELVHAELERGATSMIWTDLPGILGELRVHGHGEIARELGAAIADRYGSADPPLPPAITAPAVASALIESGRAAEGGALLSSLIAPLDRETLRALGLGEYETAGLLGWLAALQGDRAAARDALDRLRGLEAPADSEPWGAIVRAALGEREAAAAELDERLAEGLVAGRDLHFHPGLEAVRARRSSNS